ncbi:Ribonuclease 3 [Wickerhamomyces ciferrii]|uniref:Ribonuclease 3 n=1 Tax=Wickerhamomyces ciferrii (strain ATCC 14091 / BCRC 22168 / CBS 111 / JCM 3599 / NBRC 0793 / NRRL Y-1031 F-60-10) TaxID=1206466 RepID=K0KM62_WICCF|nr:Ribonuclease 3 [Wickerhamomyces ciferrii]CCH44086.1 Ribonuclease 3 [Wickerhamomyces ciferrii]
MSRDTRGSIGIKGAAEAKVSGLLKKFTYDRLFQIKRDYNNLQDTLENISRFGINNSDLYFLLNSEDIPEEIKDVAGHPSIEAAAKIKTEQDAGSFQLIKTKARPAPESKESSPAPRPIKKFRVDEIRKSIFGTQLPPLNNTTPVNFPPSLPPINDDNILKVIFTHSSAANDPSFDVYESNERLEFLGDSVLNHIISVLIFAKFPQYNEGDLTLLRSDIVCNKNLTNWSTLYGFDKQLVSNFNSQQLEQNHKKLYANVFEAYVGGLYQDSRGDINAILPWLSLLCEPIIAKAENTSSYKPLDQPEGSYPSQSEPKPNYHTANDENSKSSKQELYVLLNPIFVPQYEVVKKENGDHNPLFTVACLVNGELLGVSESRSIKLGGQMAAYDALNNNKAKVEKYKDLRVEVKEKGKPVPPKITTPVEEQIIAHRSRFGL